MTNIVRSRIVLAGIALSLIYLSLAWVLPLSAFIDVLNGIFVGVMVAVAIVYFPLFWASLRTPRFDRTAQLSVGIGCVWLSLAIARVFSAWLFVNNETGGFLSNPISGYAIFLAIIGGALHITAPGYPPENSPPLPVRFAGNNRWLLLFSAIVGGAGAVLLRYL